MRAKLGDLLVQQGLLSPAQLKRALEFQKRDLEKRKLGEVLLELNLATENELLRVVSKALAIAAVDLQVVKPTREALALVSVEEALRSLLLPLRVETVSQRRTLVVVMADPTNLETIDLLQFKLGMTVKPLLATIGQVRQAVIEAYRRKDAVEIDDASTFALEPAPIDFDANEKTWVGPPPSTQDAAEIRVTAGPNKGRIIRVSRTRELVFGRSPNADIVLQDMHLSRRHFAVAPLGSGVEVKDLGSSNGTRVNGVAVERRRLENGDRIEAGSSALLVQLVKHG